MTLNVNVDAKLTCLSFDISCTVYPKGLTTFKINMLWISFISNDGSIQCQHIHNPIQM